MKSIRSSSRPPPPPPDDRIGNPRLRLSRPSLPRPPPTATGNVVGRSHGGAVEFPRPSARIGGEISSRCDFVAAAEAPASTLTTAVTRDRRRPSILAVEGDDTATVFSGRSGPGWAGAMSHLLHHRPACGGSWCCPAARGHRDLWSRHGGRGFLLRRSLSTG
jgi:hypothetical protein